MTYLVMKFFSYEIYLFDRTQNVHFNRITSDKEYLKIGVPKGTVLIPNSSNLY